MKADAETGLRSHKPRNAKSHQKLKEARDRISQELLEEVEIYPHLDFTL